MEVAAELVILFAEAPRAIPHLGNGTRNQGLKGRDKPLTVPGPNRGAGMNPAAEPIYPLVHVTLVTLPKAPCAYILASACPDRVVLEFSGCSITSRSKP